MDKLVLSPALYNSSGSPVKSQQQIKSRLWFQYKKPICPFPLLGTCRFLCTHSKFIEH